jgi:SAM-dependent methyltransferase
MAGFLSAPQIETVRRSRAGWLLRPRLVLKGGFTLDPNEYQTMFDLENNYWWFVGRRAIVQSMLSQLTSGLYTSPHILDVGCGTGGNLTLLRRFGRAFGLDPEPRALSLCQQRESGLLVQGSATDLPFANDSMDIITALDVLEHLDDDVGALAEMRRVLRPGGSLLVTVPAYPWLWSEHDEALHHKRRYVARELRNKIEGAGLYVIELSHAISAVLPAVAAFRFVQRLRRRKNKNESQPQTAHVQLPFLLNELLIAYLYFEAWWLSFAGFPFGVSIVCAAQKPPFVNEIVPARVMSRVRGELVPEP